MKLKYFVLYAFGEAKDFGEPKINGFWGGITTRWEKMVMLGEL